MNTREKGKRMEKQLMEYLEDYFGEGLAWRTGSVHGGRHTLI